MARIATKRDVPGLKGQVVLHEGGSSNGKFFYREWIKAERKYRTQVINNAKTIDEACELAIEVAYLFRDSSTEPEAEKRLSTRRHIRRVKIEKAISEWIDQGFKKYEAGLSAKATYTNRKNQLQNQLLPYLLSENIKYTNQLDSRSLEKYLIYRANSTPMMRSKEISTFKEFIYKHCIPNGLLNELPSDLWFPKQIIRQTDRMKNPAINPADWKSLITFARTKYREKIRLSHPHSYRSHYWRDLFWHYLLFAKNTGMSPEEILRIKWGDIEIKDVGRIDSTGIRQEWLVAYVNTIRSKTKQAREIPTNQGRELKRWMSIVKDYCSEHNIQEEISNDTLVFGNPHNGFKAYNYSMYGKAWTEVREEVSKKLKGHRFSNHPYTLYSLRATFIEDHLLRGTDVFLLARIAGHDVKELMKSYERLDIRERAKDIYSIDFGKKKEEEFVVDLLEPEDE